MEEIFKNALKKYPIIDTHAHYDDEKFKSYGTDLFDKLKLNGVKAVINNSVDLEKSAEDVLNLSNSFDMFYSAIGVHPQTVDNNFIFDEQKLIKLLNNKKVVAVGEIGLDYYWSTEFKSQQIDLFIKQINIANKLNLPVIVHDREAHGDTLDILKKFKPKGTVHCYSGSVESVKEILNIGMYIGIGGVLTFKNAKKLCEVAKYVPLNRILLETDAPYLAPVPFRSKINISSYIIYVAEKLAKKKTFL